MVKEQELVTMDRHNEPTPIPTPLTPPAPWRGNLGSTSQLDGKKGALQSLVGTVMSLTFLDSKSVNICRTLRSKSSQGQCCGMCLLFVASVVPLFLLCKCSRGRGKGLLGLGPVNQGGLHEVRKG